MMDLVRELIGDVLAVYRIDQHDALTKSVANINETGIQDFEIPFPATEYPSIGICPPP